MKIGILEPSDFSEIALNKLSKLGEVELFNGQEILTFVKDKEALFVRLNIDINSDLLNNAKALKYICSPTTGWNHIDTDICEARNIQIISLKGETDFLNSIRATPEHTLGLLIALQRNYHFAFLSNYQSDWNRDPHKGFEIYASKIGIIGLGRVGRIVASYLSFMGAEVSFCDVRPIDEKYIQYGSIEELIEKNEVVLLCANYIESQGEILGEKQFNLLKNKYFINTARAELCDEDIMVELASLGHFRGLGIDVIQNEQSDKRNLKKLIDASSKHNVIVTPHIGGATFTSMKRTEEFVAEKLLKQIG